MTKRSGISIIIPVWNGEKTIKRAVKSCLKQTFRPLEILVCDDGSTDKTKSMVKSIKSTLVKWVGAKNHSGLPAVPRNRGLKIAQGEWIAFLDADDFWSPDKLKKQIALAGKNKCLAVCSNAIRFTKNKGNGLYFNFRQKKYLTLGNLLINNLVICSSMFLHYSLLERTGNFPEDKDSHGVEDYSLWLKISAIRKIAYIGKPLVVYSDQPEVSARSKVNKNYFLLKVQVLKNFINWVLKK